MTTPLRHAYIRTIAFWLFTTLLILLSLPVLAQVNGTIATSDSSGNINHGGHFPQKDSVYLISGTEGGNPLVDGNYYFQVTDPAGSTLLSQDSYHCRILIVSGEIVTGTTSEAGCTTGPHNVGSGAGGVMPVQLNEPVNFSDSANGVYKAWVTPVGDYNNPQQCASGMFHFGFCEAQSRTITFHVGGADVAYVTVCKFND